MKLFASAGFLALASLLPGAGHAAFYDQSPELHRFVGPEISYRVDTGADSTFETVSSTAEGWVSQASGPPWLGTGEPVRLWARFELPATQTPQRYFVVTGPWERVEFFFVRNGVLVGHEVTGTFVPQSERATHVTMTPPTLSGFASLDVPANSATTVYAHLATDHRFSAMNGLRFSLWGESQVRAEEGRDRLAQGIFLGVVLVLAIYNLALYWLDGRDVSYSYFVTILLCVAAMWVWASGLGSDLLWPEHPVWGYYGVRIASIAGMYSFAQFVRRYLDLGKHLPKLDVEMKWIAIAAVALPPVLYVVSRQNVELKNVRLEIIAPAGLGGAAILWACGAALKHHLPYAKLFAMAVGCAVLGAFIGALPGFDPLFTHSPLMIHAHQVGMAWMGIILSIGMGFRMRDLRAERYQHEVASRHKTDFLANMSHELRTPLNAIIGFSEVMTTGMAGPMTDKQKEFAADIRDSGRHLLGLINDILDLSKVEAGRMELDVARFNLRTAMDNSVNLVHGRADRQGIRLEQEIAPEVGDYDGDERKFKQIMLNLLTNAVKFTPEGGTVTVAARRTERNYIFSVKDTGQGIAPEDHEKVFEEFRQVSKDFVRKAEGTGLGLALTRRLVELHHGVIHLESELGKGSTFTFNLPIEAEAL